MHSRFSASVKGKHIIILFSTVRSYDWLWSAWLVCGQWGYCNLRNQHTHLLAHIENMSKKLWTRKIHVTKLVLVTCTTLLPTLLVLPSSLPIWVFPHTSSNPIVTRAFSLLWQWNYACMILYRSYKQKSHVGNTCRAHILGLLVQSCCWAFLKVKKSTNISQNNFSISRSSMCHKWIWAPRVG